MRKSYDGLQALARQAMGRDPLDGALYIFVNRRGSQLKSQYFDRSGFCIWGKRLESGKFISDWRSVRSREIDWTGLKLLLEGLEGKRGWSSSCVRRHRPSPWCPIRKYP
jgi:transposase